MEGRERESDAIRAEREREREGVSETVAEALEHLFKGIAVCR